MSHTIVHHLLIALKAIIKGVVLLTGIFFWSQFAPPVNLLLGAPLILIGLGLGLSAFYDMRWWWG